MGEAGRQEYRQTGPHASSERPAPFRAGCWGRDRAGATYKSPMRKLAHNGARALSVWFAMSIVALAVSSGAVAEPPLPPPRPPSLGSDDRSSPPLSSAPVEAAVPGSQVTEPESCLERLRKAGFGIEPAEMPKVENAECRIDQPVRLLTVPVSSQPETGIALKEKPILACVFAESLGRWLGDLVAPTVAGYAAKPVLAVQTGPGFECRNRNRSTTGKLSAHAEGMAIDISHFELADGTKLSIKPEGDGQGQEAIATLRKAACGWFTTILGPGSDAAHSDHLHVDLQKHGSSDRYRICE